MGGGFYTVATHNLNSTINSTINKALFIVQCTVVQRFEILFKFDFQSIAKNI
jgi:hypothetical protein